MPPTFQQICFCSGDPQEQHQQWAPNLVSTNKLVKKMAPSVVHSNLVTRTPSVFYALQFFHSGIFTSCVKLVIKILCWIITRIYPDNKQVLEAKVKVKMSRYRHADAKGLRTQCECVISVTPRRRFTPGKNPRHPLDRRLGGPQSWSGHRG
jgi:hypothetical protein